MSCSVAGETHELVRHEHVTHVMAGGMATTPDDPAGMACAQHHRIVSIFIGVSFIGALL